MVQVGVDLGLYRTLSQDPHKRWSLSELSTKLSTDSALLYRLLRYLVAFDLVRESEDGTYTANSTTEWLATPGAEGGVKH